MRHKLRRIASYFRDAVRLRQLAPDPRKISVAITTYNNDEFFADALRNIVADNRVGEIIVSDDCSDLSRYQRIVETAARKSEKIHIFRNEFNCGGFKNKYIALNKCSYDWAILLDCDNSLPRSYIDKIFTIPDWDNSMIYCPDFAKPAFNFFKYADLIIDKPTAIVLGKDRKHIQSLKTLLNTGNYFLPVKTFTTVVRDYVDIPVQAACTIGATYLWLINGLNLNIVYGLEYNHRIHRGSYFRKMNSESKVIVNKLFNALVNDEGFAVFRKFSP